MQGSCGRCDDFLSKPIQIAVLLDKLKAHLGLEWIEEQIEAAPVPDAAGLGPGGEQKPEKLPPRGILDEILHLAIEGAFTMLESVLDELEREDIGYQGFCDRIKECAKRYDDEAIIQFIDPEGRNG